MKILVGRMEDQEVIKARSRMLSVFVRQKRMSSQMLGRRTTIVCS